MENKNIYKNILINEDEEVINIIRRSKFLLTIQLLSPILLVVVDFFLFYPLLRFGQIGTIIFLIILLLAIFWLVSVLVKWQATVFIITNQRLIDIDHKKLFNQIISEIPLDKIDEVVCQTGGLNQVLSRTGNLFITVTNGKSKYLIDNINRPYKIQQLINQLKNDQTEKKLNQANLSADELVKLLNKIKKGLGEEKFKDLVGS
ncbi:MAG: PH domain-containing protein [Candidatus Buchananbacteria bacterium]|nr:PH domain-containing protein [Candidatus Buchananbacteria bacterium]